MSVDVDRLEQAIRHLAAIPRPSASGGEREAAEWLTGQLLDAGCRDARVEEERAHGTYWWPARSRCCWGRSSGGAGSCVWGRCWQARARRASRTSVRARSCPEPTTTCPGP